MKTVPKTQTAAQALAQAKSQPRCSQRRDPHQARTPEPRSDPGLPGTRLYPGLVRPQPGHRPSPALDQSWPGQPGTGPDLSWGGAGRGRGQDLSSHGAGPVDPAGWTLTGHSRLGLTSPLPALALTGPLPSPGLDRGQHPCQVQHHGLDVSRGQQGPVKPRSVRGCTQVSSKGSCRRPRGGGRAKGLRQ